MRVIMEKRGVEEALRNCYQLIKRMQTIPIYNCVRITGDDEGFRIEAFNGQEHLDVALDKAQVAESGACCLSCGMLWRSLQGSKAQQVTLATSKQAATVTASDVRATLHSLDVSEFPKFLGSDLNIVSEFTITAGEFAAMLKRVGKAQSEVDGDLFSGIHFCTEAQGLLVCEAYDKRRAHVQKMMIAVQGEPLDVVVSSGTIEMLRPLLHSAGDEAQIEVRFDEHKIDVVFPGMQLCAPLLEGKVPSVSAKIPPDAVNCLGIPKMDLLDALDGAARFLQCDATLPLERITLTAKGNAITISCGRNEVGTYEKRIDADECPPMSFHINHRYLKDAAESVNSDLVYLDCSDPVMPISIRDVNFTASIAPMRIPPETDDAQFNQSAHDDPVPN
jgi:DNA polymerase III sliding clamp (beta) subunit (PCNA family)